MNTISGRHALDFANRFDYIREAGTDGEKRAAEAIAEAVSQSGFEPAIEEFTIPVQIADAVSFRVTAPFDKKYPAAAYLRGGSTGEGGIEAPFLYAENGDDISLRNANGKIVLVNGPVRAPLYEKLVRSGAKAFLTVTGTPIDEGVDRIPGSARLFPGADPLLPGAVLHIADAAEIIEKGAAAARVEVRQHPSEAVSRNVTCRVKGTDAALAEETLVLCAHYDSVPAGKGAYDNLAACAILYELLRYFRAKPPRRTLEFVFFGAEEKGLCGSRAYAKAHPDVLERCRFAMNVDLAGQTVGGNVFGVTAEHCVDGILLDIAEKTGIGATVKNQIWSSDSNTFAAAGVPAMTLNRDGFGMHTRHDTPELLSAWSLERSARLLAAIAETLANADTFPFPRTVPEEYISALTR